MAFIFFLFRYILTSILQTVGLLCDQLLVWWKVYAINVHIIVKDKNSQVENITEMYVKSPLEYLFLFKWMI